ncbi:hypothetical protein PENSOL_c009G03385 [Penicillium solitum]|uniref:Transcription factor domain-containing protein n=1 Tax=Penicillium solitum TaxID=60172 RepID=A0A1V6R9W8_9EURO|nr:uncharacterized protein PENSOL_c009G03385 [Penicillium solitum]OQD98335.1 hypothetical protein PENSOL_c009G03385 [Penicillium solitum]
MLSIASNENGENGETKIFRRNVQLALNDSSIFLKPSYANVQALCFLAMHGEDYAAPNLSWMLLGHACRQAEALGLHSPAHQDLDSRQQRLCLLALSPLAPLLNRQILLPLLWKTGFSSHGIVSEPTVTKPVFLAQIQPARACLVWGWAGDYLWLALLR